MSRTQALRLARGRFAEPVSVRSTRDGQLFDRMERAARATPQPALRLRVDRDVRYQRVAEILAAARNAGLTKLSFVTDPSAPPAWTLHSGAGPNLTAESL